MTFHFLFGFRFDAILTIEETNIYYSVKVFIIYHNEASIIFFKTKCIISFTKKSKIKGVVWIHWLYAYYLLYSNPITYTLMYLVRVR